MKNCIIYHYFEKDESYKDNLRHFLTFGINNDDDFIILISGACSVDIPMERDNIRVENIENFNLDYGAYCYLFNSGFDLNPYKYIFFINSSVRGPFLAPYFKGSWTDVFTGIFSDGVGAVGSTINVLNPSSDHAVHYKKNYGGNNFSHIQTTAYCLSIHALRNLIDFGFYDEVDNLDKFSIISRYEIRMSQLLLSFGYKIKSICPEYNRIDYSCGHVDPNPTSAHGDMLVDKGYWGRTPHPYEILFIKTNRSMINLNYLDKLSFSIISSRIPDGFLYCDSSYFERLCSQSCSARKVNPFPIALDFTELQRVLQDISTINPKLIDFLFTSLHKTDRAD